MSLLCTIRSSTIFQVIDSIFGSSKLRLFRGAAIAARIGVRSIRRTGSQQRCFIKDQLRSISSLRESACCVVFPVSAPSERYFQPCMESSASQKSLRIDYRRLYVLNVAGVVVLSSSTKRPKQTNLNDYLRRRRNANPNPPASTNTEEGSVPFSSPIERL